MSLVRALPEDDVHPCTQYKFALIGKGNQIDNQIIAQLIGDNFTTDNGEHPWRKFTTVPGSCIHSI